MMENSYCKKFTNCKECMKDTPHPYCCRLECGEHEFCRNCVWHKDINLKE